MAQKSKPQAEVSIDGHSHSIIMSSKSPPEHHPGIPEIRRPPYFANN